jgi:pilus assembly protein CpaC
MRKTAFIALAAILIFSASALAAIPVEVTIGKGAVLTLKQNAKRISLSDPDIVELILMSPTEIVLNGKMTGTTTLITWDEEGKRTFFDVMVFGDLDELRGHIESLAPGQEVEVERAADTLILKGRLKSEDTIRKIEELSKSYAAKVISYLRVAQAEQIVLEVKVAQIDRTKLKELGLSFLVRGIGHGVGGNAELTSPGFVASPGGTLGGDAGPNIIPGIDGFDLDDATPQLGISHYPTGISIFLRALANNGLAKILAEPNLIVRSGESGEFHVGTRVPVQQVTGVGGNQTVSIRFEEVGIRINFAPQVLDDGTIRLKIDPAEVSNITELLPVQNIIAPVIDTRTVRTAVDLKSGESLVMAGLLSEETRKNLQKIPILGDIPILGALFRSTRDEIDKTELAFFITPKLIKPLPPGERPMLPGEGEPTVEEEREFDWIPISIPKASGASAGQEAEGSPEAPSVQ